MMLRLKHPGAFEAIRHWQPVSARTGPVCAASISLPFALLALAAAVGCTSRPARVEPPDYDAAAIGENAVSSMDRNGDQLLDADELASSPALLAGLKGLDRVAGLKGPGLKGLDRERDERLSADEIAARVDLWTEGGVGAVAAICLVKRAGAPVPNVQVRFVPETFLGDVIKPAVGVTDASGTTMLTAEGQLLEGVLNCGFYRVELSLLKDGKETIPEKFNSRTILGAEVRPKLEVNFVYDLAQ